MDRQDLLAVLGKGVPQVDRVYLDRTDLLVQEETQVPKDPQVKMEKRDQWAILGGLVFLVCRVKGAPLDGTEQMVCLAKKAQEDLQEMTADKGNRVPKVSRVFLDFKDRQVFLDQLGNLEKMATEDQPDQKDHLGMRALLEILEYKDLRDHPAREEKGDSKVPEVSLVFPVW